MLSYSTSNTRYFTTLLLGTLLGCFGACAEDETEETPTEVPEDCQAIGDVCTHDTPGELAAECHDVSHAGDAEVCAERKQECVSFCTSAAGGAGGEAGAQQ